MISKRNFYRDVRECGICNSLILISYSGPYFPAFGLNTESYSVSLRIQSECGKMRTRITPNTDTFYAVLLTNIWLNKTMW